MGNYVATVQISHPINTNLKEDVNLNGVSFSYEHGLFYVPSEEIFPVQLPPPWQPGMVATGKRGKDK